MAVKRTRYYFELVNGAAAWTYSESTWQMWEQEAIASGMAYNMWTE